MEIDRWDVTDRCYDPRGDWVRFEDHERALRALQARLADAEAEIARHRAWQRIQQR